MQEKDRTKTLAILAVKACNECRDEHNLNSGVTYWTDTCDICGKQEFVKHIKPAEKGEV